MQANKEATVQMRRQRVDATAALGKSEIKKCKNQLTGKWNTALGRAASGTTSDMYAPAHAKWSNTAFYSRGKVMANDKNHKYRHGHINGNTHAYNSTLPVRAMNNGA